MRISSLYILFISLLMMSCDDKSGHTDKTVDTNSENEATYLMQEINKYPDSFLLKENLIQLYRDSGNYTKAIQMATKFLAEDSLQPRLHHVLGYLHFENGDTLNAIRDFEMAFLLFPNHDDMMLFAQLAAMKGMEKAKIISDSLKTSKDDINSKQGYFISALYYRATNKYNTALKNLDTCLQKDHTFMQAYLEKAKIEVLLRDHAKAVATLKKAVTIQNNFSEGYLLLGNCQEILKDKTGAAESYRRVLLYLPDNEEALEGLDRCVE